MQMVGFAGDSAPHAVFLSLSSGPRWSASWPVWTRGTVIWRESGSGMYKVGFSGVSAPRAVCPRRTGKLDYFGRWRLCFFGPLYLAVTCSCFCLRSTICFFLGDDSRNGFSIQHSSWFNSRYMFGISLRGFWKNVTRRSSLFTVACAGLVLLVAMHLALFFLLASPSPKCSASWLVWTRRTGSVDQMTDLRTGFPTFSPLHGCRSFSVRPSLLLAFPVSEGPARPLLSISMHAAGASTCPNVSISTSSTYGHGCLLSTSPGHSEFCKYLTRLAYGFRRTCGYRGPWRCSAGANPASVRTRDRRSEAGTDCPGPQCPPQRQTTSEFPSCDLTTRAMATDWKTR